MKSFIPLCIGAVHFARSQRPSSYPQNVESFVGVVNEPFESEPPSPFCDIPLLDRLQISLGVPEESRIAVGSAFLSTLFGQFLNLTNTAQNSAHQNPPEATASSVKLKPASEIFPYNMRHHLRIGEPRPKAELVGAHAMSWTNSILSKLFKKLIEVPAELDSGKPGTEMVEAFAQANMTRLIMENLVTNVSVVGLKASFDSPMKNVGGVLCNAIDASATLDGEMWHTFTCAYQTLVFGLCLDKLNFEVPMDVCDRQKPPMDPSDSNLTVDLTLQRHFRGVTERAVLREGVLHYWLFRATSASIDRLANYILPCEIKEEIMLVPGWDTTLIAEAGEPGDPWEKEAKQEGRAIAAVAKRRDACDFLIVIRGTRSQFEWLKNTNLRLVPFGSYGRVHEGFLQSSASYFPRFIDHLRHQASLCSDKSSRPHLMVSGFSQGAGVAHVVALVLADHLPKFTVDMVAFAAPRVFDQSAMDRLEKLVNVRNWAVEFDVVPEVPCSTPVGIPRCDSRTNFGHWGVGNDTFANNINKITIPQSVLGKLNPLFNGRSFGSLGLSATAGQPTWDEFKIPGPLQLAANHICGYGCYLSSLFCTTGEGWRCNCPFLLMNIPHL